MASSFHIPDKGSFLDSSDMYPHNYFDLYTEHTPGRSVFNDILADSSELGYPLLVDNEGDTNHNDESVLDLLPWHLLSEPIYTDPLSQPEAARVPMPAPLEPESSPPQPQSIPGPGYPQHSSHYMATPQTPSMAYSPEQEPVYAYSRPHLPQAPRTPDGLAWTNGPSTTQAPFEQQEQSPVSTPRQSPIQDHDNFWNAFQFGINNEATFGGPVVHYTLLYPFAHYPEVTYNPPFLGNLSFKTGFPFAQESNNYIPGIPQHISVHVASPLFHKDSQGRTIEPQKLQHGHVHEYNHAYSTNHGTSTSVFPQPSEHDCLSDLTCTTNENESESEAAVLSSWPSPHSLASPGCSSRLFSSSGSSSQSSCSSPSPSVASSPSSRFTLSSRGSSPSDLWSSDSENDDCSEIDEYTPTRDSSSATTKRAALNSELSKEARLYPKSSTSNASNRDSSVSLSPEISIDSDSDDIDEFSPAVSSSMRAPSRKPASTTAKASRSIKKRKRTTSTDEKDHGESQADPAKRFTCTFPGCHRLFTRLFNMRTHERTHNPNQERPFVCSEPSCCKRFSRKHDMQRHEASVHRGEGRYGCPFCGRSFARRDGLQKHQGGHGGPCQSQ